LTSEEELAKRVLRFNLKKILCPDEGTLLDKVKQLYPTAAHVVTVNLDQRDSDGSPHIVTHRIRSVTITTRTIRLWNGNTETRAAKHHSHSGEWFSHAESST